MTTSKQADDRSYVTSVLAMYTALYETPDRARFADRRLAAHWNIRGISLQTVESALLLGQLRRLARPQGYPKLQPIRSLYYFVPMVEEVLASPLDPEYMSYVRMTLKRLEIRVSRPQAPAPSGLGA
jgi:hypothetical protein